MSTPNNIPTSILDGTDEIITKHLNQFTPRGEKKKFTTKTTLIEVCRVRGELDLLNLLIDIWNQIESNWIDGGRLPGGCDNWRWEPKLYIHAENRSAETRLEKGLATALPRENWANQVPTSSGLVSSDADHKRNIDLVRWDGIDTVTLIELKAPTAAATTKQTPLLAAFEIVQNALLLCFARAHQESNPPIRIARREIWLHAKRANLRVVAPERFYDPLHSLNWFEQELNRAVSAFRKPNSPEMSFSFNVFDLTAIFHEAVERSRAYPLSAE